MGITTISGLDLETDSRSGTPCYNGFRAGSENIFRVLK